MADPPEVTILLLGDTQVGKSTLISRISKGSTSHSTQTLLTPLRDLDQPFIFDISLFKRPYRFSFYDTSSPENWTLLEPDVIVFCYDISSRSSLLNIKQWAPLTITHFTHTSESGIPILLLGLKRDLRSLSSPEPIIYPQEGHQIAQELRCDRYMECSAVTGELVHEVFEDMCRTAALTTTEGGNGGLSEGGCEIM